MWKVVIFVLINVFFMSCASTKVMNPAAKQLVNEALNLHKIVIFSKSYCPYCKMAKDVFDKLQVTPHVVELDHRDDGDAIQDIMHELTGARSVPRVFVNGKFIGGGTDVKALYEKGALAKMLNNDSGDNDIKT